MKPNKTFLPLLLLIFLTLLKSLSYANGPEDAPSKYNILFLSSFGKELPAQDLLERGLNKVLHYKEGEKNLYFEFMDSPRLAQPSHPSLKKYLLEKYQRISFNYVIAWDIQAALFLCKHRELFPRSQRILLEVDQLELQKEKCSSNDDIVIITYNDYLASLKEIFKLKNPDTIFVIGTTTDITAKNRLSTFQTEIKKISKRIKISYLLDQNIDFISDQLRISENDNTIALYLLMFSDGKGKNMTPFQIVKTLSSQSKIPIFSYWDSLMGSGIVGGYLISFDKLGEYVGKIILNKNLPGKHFTLSPMEYIYDYNALRKWDINEDNLPPHALILNSPPSLFKYYKWKIITIGLSFIFLIIVLFLIYRQFVIKKTNTQLMGIQKELKKTNEELNFLSSTDPLTGLYNRRAIEKIITDEINRNIRYKHPVSLLILDLDFFKKVNDVHGHSVGDNVLKKVSETIQKSIRITDKASRWGGEEFLILAVNTRIKNAFILGEKIRGNIMTIKIENIEKITVSIGIAEYAQNEEFLSWYERADKALYLAKENGRNRVEYLQTEQQKFKKEQILKLEWEEEYSSGNELIDDQHRRLFNQINDIIDSFLKKDNQINTRNLIEALYSSTEKHFNDEEEILEKIGYPETHQHKEIHKELLSHFFHLKTDYLNNNIENFLFLEFMTKNIILDHILKDDFDYFEYIN